MTNLEKLVIAISSILTITSTINISYASDSLSTYNNKSTLVDAAPVNGKLGTTMRNIGHFSSTTQDDLAISVPGKGIGYVIFGTKNSAFTQVANIDKFKPEEALKIIYPSKETWDVNRVGDLNGDGFDELIVSSVQDGHRVYIIWGGEQNKSETANVINLLDIDKGDNSRGVRIFSPDDWFGTSVAGISYFNKDGKIRDLAIGNIDSIGGRGSVTVIAGKKSSVGSWKNIDLESKGTGWDKVLVAKNNHVTAFIAPQIGPDDGRTNALHPSNVNLGAQITSVGDINGDGKDDFVVVDPYAQNYGGSEEKSIIGQGTAYLIYGSDTEIDHLKLSEMSASKATRLHGMAGSLLGQAGPNEQSINNGTVTGIGRCFFHGDKKGPASFAISAPQYRGSDGQRSGVVWLIKGKTSQVGENGSLMLDTYHTAVNYTKQFSREDGYAIRSSRLGSAGMGFGTNITVQATTDYSNDKPSIVSECENLIISDPNAMRNGNQTEKAGAVYVIPYNTNFDEYADDDGTIIIDDLLINKNVKVYWGDTNNGVYGTTVASGKFFGNQFDSPIAISSPAYNSNSGKVDFVGKSGVAF